MYKSRPLGTAMQTTLKAIREQLELCSALMSDPHFMRHQSAHVANQFDAAFARIEQLGVFLERPPTNKEGPWFDRSVIECGIKPLVAQILRKHMEPLRLEKFPKVFALDLRPAGQRDTEEHRIEREIKETNCLGAMVVLYYYIIWYALLIVLNGKKHGGGDEDRSHLLREFIESQIPKGKDLLEYRHLFPEGVTDDKKNGLRASGAFGHFLFDPGFHDNFPARSTRVAMAYREVLNAIAGDPQAIVLQSFSRKMGGLLAVALGDRAAIFGGVLSTVNWQEETTKWEDMYRDIEVQSESKDPQKKVHALYNCKLAKVLKNLPYNTETEFKVVASRLAVFVYSSFPLMTDIIRSALVLRLLLHRVQTENTDEYIEAVLLQACGRQGATLGRDEFKMVEKPETFYHEKGIIQENSTRARAAINLSGEPLTGCLFVDDILGYYWGSRYSEKSNHQFLSWADLQVDQDSESPVIDRIQHLCNEANQRIRRLENTDDKKYARLVIIHRFLVPSLRNSSLVSALLQTATKMSDLASNRNAVRIRVPNNHILFFDENAEEIRMTTGFANRLPQGGMWEVHPPAVPEIHVSLPEAIEKLKSEYAVYQGYADQVKRKLFNKYVSISWPVRYDNGDNFKILREVGVVPARTPSLAESAMNVARSVERFPRLVELVSELNGTAREYVARPPQAAGRPNAAPPQATGN